MHSILSGNLSYHSGPSPNSPDEYAIRPVSSNGQMIDVAIAKWFGLLAGDAAREGIGFSQTPDGFSYNTNNMDAVVNSNGEGPNIDCNNVLQAQIDPILRGPEQNREAEVFGDKTPWQSPEVLSLRDHEKFIFRNFVQRASHWIDLFDPMKHFSTYVPHLAMRNVGLFQAILALSVRHLSLIPSVANEKPLDRNDALQYYNETLQYVQKAMQYDDYNTSLELLCHLSDRIRVRDA